MVVFEHTLLLLLLTTGLSVVGRWLPWPAPITLVGGGVLAAFLPGFPTISLDPGFFFLFFLPPLLFADGWLMPLREFAKAKRPILILAVGLVVFTTVLVGLVVHALIPDIPLAMAFALGAVVSPTDAVAVSAITERLKVPTRLRVILNGESLMNDATGLVAFKFALGAMMAGAFSLRAAAQEFILLAGGGLLLGLAVGYGIGRARDGLRAIAAADEMIEITLSLLTPYAAYLLAEGVGVSPILAVVAAGLYSGWRDPVRMDVETRRTAYAVWSTMLFWLNGLAFILLGLQFPAVVAEVRGLHTPGELLLYVAVVSGVVMAGRLAWFYPGAWLPRFFSRHIRETEPAPSWQGILVGGWAGMRGSVTLAAALSIPLLMENGQPFPARPMVIFLAFGVIVTTLLVQGTTLSALICWLGLREDDTQSQEERLARIRAVEAGLGVLRAEQKPGQSEEAQAALSQVLGEYEHRLAELTAEGETQASASRRRSAGREFRLLALTAERQAVDGLWRGDHISDEVHRPLQMLLDHEESMLRALPAQAQGEG